MLSYTYFQKNPYKTLIKFFILRPLKKGALDKTLTNDHTHSSKSATSNIVHFIFSYTSSCVRTLVVGKTIQRAVINMMEC